MTRLLAAAFAVAALAACPPRPGECQGDADCGDGRHCVEINNFEAGVQSACVACRDSGDCGADQFCCGAECLPSADVDAHCGCSAAPGAQGTSCSGDQPVCLVGAGTATAANVDQGQCGCGCTPDQGGPTCSAPANAGDPPQCTCAENTDCRRATVDAQAIPHRSADTCSPDASCVCFHATPQAPCDPNGDAPDCSSTGCASLETDAHDCGTAGVDCTVAATGIDGTGTCVDGGCTCDDAADCSGGNVDLCAFVTPGEPSRCVCAGFTRDGKQAACPLELACSAGGCVLDGTPYATSDALNGAL